MRTVLSVHGIRTRAAWQKGDLSQLLGVAGFHHVPLDYGYFPAIFFVIRAFREKKIRWFVGEYDKFASELQEPPHVIAHSFGTYIVCEALRRYGSISVGKIVLCGSIVDARYPWKNIFAQNRVDNVLNDIGTADIWAKTVAFAVSDTGPSGRTGFVDVDDVPLVQRRLPTWQHSDFFHRLEFATWIRFLKGEELGPVGVSWDPKTTWQAWVGRAIAITIAGIALTIMAAFLTRPVNLSDGVIAAKYGVLQPEGGWDERRFERESGDSDGPPREGDTVVALKNVDAFHRVPRRWLSQRLGPSERLRAGERFQVRRVHAPAMLGLWATLAILPKPDALADFNYRFRYSAANGCIGFILSNDSGAWVEYTPGEQDCSKTLFHFTQATATEELLILFDRDRGMYFRVPFKGGATSLAGPNLPPDTAVEQLVWSPHYRVQVLAH